MRHRRSLIASLSALSLATLLWSFAAPTRSTPPQQDGLPDLVGPLLATEGCLGVETARTDSGKQLIFAWFESKAACAAWYWSEVHQGAARAFFPDREAREPMKDVPDAVGPVMAVASITMSSEREIDESTLPIAQISIELYTPLRAGLSIGGSFAPEGLKVPRRHITLAEEGR
jgi:hypothetical protein